MTEDLIKEYLSNHYVGIIAGRSGYFLEKPSSDSGVDFVVRFNVEYSLPGGKKEYTPSPQYCDLQIKATTSKTIKLDAEYVIYDLRAKNYRDLIRRRDLGVAPLYLILFILPEEKKSWVKIFENRISLSKHAYWFYPDATYQLLNNSSTNRIKIPLRNKLNMDFFKEKIDAWYNLS